MALWPGPDSATFYLDPAAGLTDGNLWKDSGKWGLHVTPVGYAAPAFGLSLGPSGAPRITFNGANQYGAMSAGAAARFYANMPRTAATIACVARYGATAAPVRPRLFSARTSAPLTGIELFCSPVDRLNLNGYDALGAWSGVVDGVDVPLVGRTRVSILSCTAGAGALQQLFAMHDGTRNTVVPGGASAVTPWVVAADAPLVGAMIGGVSYFSGDLYHLAIYPLIFTHQEALACSAFWLDRI